MKSSDRAWIVLGVGVVGYDVCCEETMSEAADRYMLRHPWVVRAIAFAIASHCCNVLPNRLDPVHLAFVAVRRLRVSRC